MSTIPVVLVGRDYWSRFLPLDWLAAEAFIDPSDALLPRIVDSGLEARREIQAFYRERGVTVGGLFDDERPARNPPAVSSLAGTAST